MRVVSLLPSATEMLLVIVGPAALDGSGPVALVGRSHECDWPVPPALNHVPILTAARVAFTSSAEVDQRVREQLATGESLYTLDADLLRTLAPDVVLTQDLCAVCSIDLNAVRRVVDQIGRDGVRQPTVLSFNPLTVDGVLDDLLRLGRALGMDQRAMEVVVGLRERMDRAEAYVNPFTQPVRVAFLEWTDPVFVGGHWTPQLVERAGGSHLLNPTRATEAAGAAVGTAGQTQRVAGKSVRVSVEELVASAPEVVMICPCGLSLDHALRETDLLAKQAWFRELPAVQQGRVAVIDGNQMFNRPGPRLVDSLEFLVGYLNSRPELTPAGFPWRAWRSH